MAHGCLLDHCGVQRFTGQSSFTFIEFRVSQYEGPLSLRSRGDEVWLRLAPLWLQSFFRGMLNSRPAEPCQKLVICADDTSRIHSSKKISCIGLETCRDFEICTNETKSALLICTCVPRSGQASRRNLRCRRSSNLRETCETSKNDVICTTNDTVEKCSPSDFSVGKLPAFFNFEVTSLNLQLQGCRRCKNHRHHYHHHCTRLLLVSEKKKSHCRLRHAAWGIPPPPPPPLTPTDNKNGKKREKSTLVEMKREGSVLKRTKAASGARFWHHRSVSYDLNTC